MLSDGTKAEEVEEQVGTYDIAELLERSIFGEHQIAEPEVEEVLEETVVVADVVESEEVMSEPELAVTVETEDETPKNDDGKQI